MRKRKKQGPGPGDIDHQKLAMTLVRTRAQRALEDEPELHRQAGSLAEQLGYATSDKKQSDAGTTSRGRRGIYDLAHERLRAEVLSVHRRALHA